ncbi:MAG: ATP-binding protein [Bryobacterales bacterium]|nr:ATP-binding protein [Bryobacterales bacterium]
MTRNETIHEALSNAFSIDSLRRMLANKLDRDLDNYAAQGDKRQVIFELLQAARRENFLDDLIAAAQEANPGNDQLRALSPSRPAAECAKIFHVPSKQNRFFAGRDAQIGALAAALAEKNIAALTGLGGIGKSQLALEYAYRYRDRYPLVFWMQADSEAALNAGFGELARRLNLPARDASDQGVVRAAVMDYLATSPCWLLVLDNAADPTSVKPYLPVQYTGHVLLTSRVSIFQSLGLVSPLELEVLPPEDARQFLYTRTGRAPGTAAAAVARLAAELGFLPLALEQAAAYIVEKQARFEDYLSSFLKQRLKLLGRQRPVGAEPVATTWTMNFKALAETPAARDLLRLSAFLAPENIPLELLRQAAPHLGQFLSKTLEGVSDDPLIVDEKLLEPLTHYSLIRRNLENDSYSLHKLVQEVVATDLDRNRQRQWAERAVRAVNAVFPSVEFCHWPTCSRLLAHALVCADSIARWNFTSADAARLLDRTASYLMERAQYAEAEPLFERALAIRENPKLFGPSHAYTAASINNLALLYHYRGRNAASEALYRRALTIWEDGKNPVESYTATSLENLASLCRHTGRYPEAEPLLQRALTICERLDPLGPETADCLDQMALLFFDQQRYREAEPLCRRALEIREKRLEPDHPDLASSFNNLGMLLHNQEHFDQAELLFKNALAIREKALGPGHPATVNCRTNYARLLLQTGREAEALKLGEGFLTYSSAAGRIR